jgi:hypothetical protein
LQVGTGRAKPLFMIRLALAALALPLVLAGCKPDAPEPAASDAAGAEQAPSPVSVEEWLRANELGDDAAGGPFEGALYAKAETDLDGDGVDEVLVYVGGPMFCGSGGCNLLVLKRGSGGFAAVGDLSVVQRPVGVLDSSTNGWRDLAVSVSGGGNPGGTMKLMFDGKAYPSNPTVAPAEPVDSLGTVLIGQGPLKPLD